MQALRDKVMQPGRREADPNKPNWEEICTLLGITPAQVRQWRVRTQSSVDIRQLLGEQPRPPGQRESPEARNAQAAKHLEMLSRAVLEGDDVKAEQLAAAFAERYGF